MFRCFDGCVLGNEQRRQPLTYREFKVVLAQVLDALKYLHGLGFYHGDLGPESIIVRCRWPTLDVALMNFDTNLNKSHTETGIRKDMDCFGQILLYFLCGSKEPSDVSQCERLQSASGRQVFASFKSARYDAIAAGITHAEALLSDRDFRSVLNDEGDIDNAAQLPLPMTPLLEPDQISLPDTEAGDNESDGVFECPRSCQKMRDRRQTDRQSDDPSGSLPRRKRKSTGKRQAGLGRDGGRSRAQCQMKLRNASTTATELVISPESLFPLHPRRPVTRRRFSLSRPATRR